MLLFLFAVPRYWSLWCQSGKGCRWVLERSHCFSSTFNMQFHLCVQAADASRERKKKFVTQHESLKFTKTLQAASKSLKPLDQQVTTSSSEQGSRKSSVSEEMSDSKKSEPPVIPAKPARLLSASELKKSEAGKTASEITSSYPASSVSHTVTVTSQISDGGDKKAVEVFPSHRSSARSVFFSSLQSPVTSPTSQPETSKTFSKLPSASKGGPAVSSAPSTSSTPSSGVTSSTSPSHSKPMSGVFYQALSPTRTRPAVSSIPLPSKPSPSDKDDSSSGASDKGKKVPPPPPPRKSSAKLPYGFGGGSALSTNVNGGSESSRGRRNSGEKASDSRKKDSALVYKANSPTSPGATGPLSSTPKPTTPQKPAMNKFQRDLAAGIYANLNRPDLQHQRMVPDQLITSMASPPPAAVTTNRWGCQDLVPGMQIILKPHFITLRIVVLTLLPLGSKAQKVFERTLFFFFFKLTVQDENFQGMFFVKLRTSTYKNKHW